MYFCNEFSVIEAVSILCKTAKGPKLHLQAGNRWQAPAGLPALVRRRTPQNDLFARRRALTLGGAQVRRHLSHHWTQMLEVQNTCAIEKASVQQQHVLTAAAAVRPTAGGLDQLVA
jgi:hypothetical protein